MATKEKMHPRSKLGKIDMNMVEQLIKWRETRNNQLKDFAFKCSLYPDENKRICETCPTTIRKACFKYEWERDYIHKQEKAKLDNQMRKKKKRKEGLPSDQACYYDENDYDEHNEEVGEATKYPCKELYFACPDSEFCNHGKKCDYKPTIL